MMEPLSKFQAAERLAHEERQRKIASGLMERSEKLHDKYVYFTTSLVLSVLAVSVQTAKFGHNDVADFLELVAWSLLLLSGLLGLAAIPYLYKALKEEGQYTQSPAGNVLQEFDRLSKKATKRQRFKSYTMYLGISGVAISRAIPALSYLWERIF